jgi:hypothetical protein
MIVTPHDKIEIVELLTPLVLPMIRDQAIIGKPINGNILGIGVSIQYKDSYVTLTTDQYELLRTEVLIYVTEKFQGYILYDENELQNLIRDRLEEVFINS